MKSKHYNRAGIDPTLFLQVLSPNVFIGWLGMIVAMLLSAGCRNGGKTSYEKTAAEQAAILKDSANYTSVEWPDSTYKDFGHIAEGQKLEVSFRMKNTGPKPLVITKVQPSCGCTLAETPDAPLAPGATGSIKATFNSEGHAGTNRKNLFVFANTTGNAETILQFVVNVDKKKW